MNRSFLRRSIPTASLLVTVFSTAAERFAWVRPSYLIEDGEFSTARADERDIVAAVTLAIVAFCSPDWTWFDPPIEGRSCAC